ncbi:hypothetical protein QJQ45_006068 [Haematococcus lacustris]|nr:hypothetical protein QJQ45_006068 [Haematococcus lacustris]
MLAGINQALEDELVHTVKTSDHAVQQLSASVTRMYINESSRYNSSDFPAISEALQRAQPAKPPPYELVPDVADPTSQEVHNLNMAVLQNMSSHERESALQTGEAMLKPPRRGRQADACPVDEAALQTARGSVEKQLTSTALSLTADLESRFPPSKQLSAFAMLTPSNIALYWTALYQQLGSFQVAARGVARAMKAQLDDMRHRAAKRKPGTRQQQSDSDDSHGSDNGGYDVQEQRTPLLSEFWKKLHASMASQLSELCKVATLLTVTVPGSVEEERSFSAMNFIKDERRNRLGANLSSTLRVYLDKTFTLKTFPHKEAIDDWMAGASAKGRYLGHSG